MKSWPDWLPVVFGVGAICVTLGVGTCSTNARIGVARDDLDVTLGVGTCSTNARIGDVNARLDDANANVNARLDDANANVNTRLDAVQVDIRELRALIIDALKRPEPAD